VITCRFDRRLTRALAALLALAGTAACGPREVAAPSVVLVVIDTLRRDHLSLYGYERDTSPRLDRLAPESAVFERCIATSSWTKPSTVSLLSGLYPASHGANRNRRASDEIEFIGEVLQRRGFATAAFSGNPHVSSAFGMDQGFDHFGFGGNRRAREYPDLTELLAGARAWLAGSSERPFLLYLHLMNVHGPYRAPASYRERFLSEPHAEFPFQNNLWKDIVRRGRLERRADVRQAHLNDLSARYDGAVAYTDEILARFLDELRADGILDRSLLVITSDHGEELFEHGGFGHKRTLYGELLEIPLLIREPTGIGAGRRIDEPVSLVDVPATVLDWLGILGPENAGRFASGHSLLPLLRRPPEDGPTGRPEGDRALLAQLDEPSAGRAFLVQQWPHRLLQIEKDYQGRRHAVELFDVAADPGEHVDLASQRPQRVAELEALAGELRGALEAQPFEGDPARPDDELVRQLEALGYGR
jgi:arylsulfatase A-like enzyme